MASILDYMPFDNERAGLVKMLSTSHLRPLSQVKCEQRLGIVVANQEYWPRKKYLKTMG